MKESICGADCANCRWKNACPGCSDRKCFIAKYIKTGGKEMLFWTKEEYLRFAEAMMDKPMSYYAFEVLYENAT